MTKTTDHYDSPWKEIIEAYFEEFLAFFFPHVHADLDWAKGYEFLDKELQQIAPDSEASERNVDKLIKAWRSSGQEEWVLIHVEVQSQRNKKAIFEERMFIYHYRIYDKYRRKMASFAILGDEDPRWQPNHFEYTLWNCKIRLDFPTVKLLTYQASELEQNPNPFAVVVLAHLYTKMTKNQAEMRLTFKWQLTRLLYERGYDSRQIRQLFRFIDWVMKLPEDLSIQHKAQLNAYEEAKTMRYVTSIERLAIKEGLIEGRKEGRKAGRKEGRKEGLRKGQKQTILETILEILQVRFGEVQQPLIEMINGVKTITQLKQLRRESLTVESLEKFKELLESEAFDKVSLPLADRKSLQMAREAIQDVLLVRFGQLEEELIEMLQQVNELPQLKTLLREAVMIESLAEFMNLIGRQSSSWKF